MQDSLNLTLCDYISAFASMQKISPVSYLHILPPLAIFRQLPVGSVERALGDECQEHLAVDVEESVQVAKYSVVRRDAEGVERKYFCESPG